MLTDEQINERKELRKKKTIEAIADFFANAKEHHRKMYDRMPKRYQNGWLRAFLGVANKRQAIQAKCYECVAYEAVQENVGGCTARTCPLWHYRPLQKKGKK